MSFATVADQFEFEGFPTYSAAQAENPVLLYMRLSREKGGLIPQGMIHEALGVSKMRVSQLVNSGRFEVHRIAGKAYVTGDSFESYLVEEKRSGRGHKAPTFKTLVHAAVSSLSAEE